MTASNLATPVLGVAGQRVYANAHTTTAATVYGNIVSNTTSVITVDKWWTAADTTGTTPTSGDGFIITPGGLSAVRFMALTTNSSSASAADTTLASEITNTATVNSVTDNYVFRAQAAGGAADPLTNPLGDYTSGQAGGALQLIGTVAVNVTSPVAQNGRITIVSGDDYKAADGRALVFSGTSSNVWPNLTDAVISLIAGAMTGSGSVLSPTGNQIVQIELTSAETLVLGHGANVVYYLIATLADGHITTLATGRLQTI